jgi:hypothetical protein
MSREELLRRLRSFEVGFYAVANAYERGTIDEATISEYLRRDAPKVVPESRDARMQLAKDLDR